MQRRDFLGLTARPRLSIPRPGYAQTKTDMPLVGLLLVQKLETSVAKEELPCFGKACRMRASSMG